VLAWSFAECARYIESLAYYEGKPSTSIQEKQETEFLPRLQKCLLNVRSVQKPDVQTLLDNFGSFKQICTASEQQLLLCPGFGEKKAKRLHQIMNFPLNSSSSVAAASSSSSSSLKKAKTKNVDDDVDTAISGV
jgi:DNA excision repair protein ERCC-1